MILGKPVAFGRTAEIYAWGDHQILKLFRPVRSAVSAEHEARIARAVHAIGLPVPAVGELLELNGRFGIVYERVEARSLFTMLKASPWALWRSARLCAELHASLHSRIIPELPSLQERLERQIQTAGLLPSHLREAALQSLQAMPDGDILCHGDFHPDNILITAQGPIIIDWADATRGHPLADVTRTALLARLAVLPPDTPRWIAFGRRWFLKTYLKRYFELRPSDREQLAAWEPIVAAARLREGITEEQDQLLTLIQNGLARHG